MYVLLSCLLVVSLTRHSIPQDFPSPVPITPLSAEFLRQGERHLGVSTMGSTGR